MANAQEMLQRAKNAITNPLDREGLLSEHEALTLVRESPNDPSVLLWVDACLELLVDSLMRPSSPPGDLLTPMIRCLGVASEVVHLCLRRPQIPRSNLAAAPPPSSLEATPALPTSPAPAMPEAPAQRWLALLSRILDPQSPLWAHVTHRDLGGLPSASNRGPKTLHALAADLTGAGCIETLLGLLREPAPAPSSSSAPPAAGGDGAGGAGAHGRAGVPSSSSTVGSATTVSAVQPVEPAPSAKGGIKDGAGAGSAGAAAAMGVGTPSALMSADLVESIVVTLSLVVNSAAAANMAPAAGTLLRASKLAAQAIGRIELKRLKRTDGQRLVLAVQRLQLLVPQDSRDAALAGFGALVPPRVAVAARSLSSPILELRLWAVKDLALLIGQASQLAASTSDVETGQAPVTVADAILRERVPSLLVGDAAHEEVLIRAAPLFTSLLLTQRLDEAALRGLWQAPATKSSAVAAAATSLLAELLRHPKCPPALHIALLEAVGAACMLHLSVRGQTPLPLPSAHRPLPSLHTFALIICALADRHPTSRCPTPHRAPRWAWPQCLRRSRASTPPCHPRFQTDGPCSSGLCSARSRQARPRRPAPRCAPRC